MPPSTCSKLGGKQWQHSIRGWEYYLHHPDVEKWYKIWYMFPKIKSTQPKFMLTIVWASWGGGDIKKEYKLLNLRALRISTSYNNLIFQCVGTLWNSTQNILTIHWQICILFTGQNFRALRFKNSSLFLKWTPGLVMLLKVSSWHLPSCIFHHTWLIFVWPSVNTVQQMLHYWCVILNCVGHWLNFEEHALRNWGACCENSHQMNMIFCHQWWTTRTFLEWEGGVCLKYYFILLW